MIKNKKNPVHWVKRFWSKMPFNNYVPHNWEEHAVMLYERDKEQKRVAKEREKKRILEERKKIERR
jgi:hypothetical protein